MDVGIHCHTEGEDDPGNARQGQGRTNQGQRGHQQDEVDEQGEGGVKAESSVVNEHEDDDEGETDERGVHALVDVLFPGVRADGAFFDDVHRGDE